MWLIDWSLFELDGCRADPPGRLPYMRSGLASVLCFSFSNYVKVKETGNVIVAGIEAGLVAPVVACLLDKKERRLCVCTQRCANGFRAVNGRYVGHSIGQAVARITGDQVV